MKDTTLIERGIERRDSVIKETLKWVLKENRIEDALEKEGYKTLYCAQEKKEHRTRTTKILEHRGTYIMMVDGKSVHIDSTLDKCVSWGQQSGYIDKTTNTIRKAVTASTHAAPAPKAPTPRTPAPASSKSESVYAWPPIASYGYVVIG